MPNYCTNPPPMLPGIPDFVRVTIPQPPAPFIPPPLPAHSLPRFITDFPLGLHEVLYFLATLCRASYGPDASFFTTATRAVLNGTNPITFVPNGPAETPGYAIVRLDRCAIVVVSGTSNLAQWQAQLFTNGQVNTNFSPTGADKGQTMAIYKTAADAIHTALNVAVPNDRPVLLCGHSMGGAVAAVLHYRYSVAGFSDRPPSRLVTFAMPKPGNQRLRSEARDGPQVFKRLFIHGDIVPALPPDLGAVSLAVPPSLRPVSTTWSSYQPMGDAETLSEIGLMEGAAEPNPGVAIGVAMLNAAVGNPLGIVDAHQIRTYTTFLRAGFTEYREDLLRTWANPGDLDRVNVAMRDSGL